MGPGAGVDIVEKIKMACLSWELSPGSLTRGKQDGADGQTQLEVLYIYIWR
jgi:hypothetical protein